ncbi:MAG: HAMP domain-containing protein, partial [Streptosporangiales bacterium]
MTWPLRVRLVVAVVLLVAMGLAVTGFAAVTVLRTYLLGEVDSELQATAQSTAAAARGEPFPQQHDQRPELPSAYMIFITGPAGNGTRYSAPTQENPYPPQLPQLTASTAQRLAGEPFTVRSTRGPTRWRVIVTPLNDGSGGAVTVAVSLAEVDNTVGRLIAIIVVVGAAVLVLVAGMGYLLVRGSLRPLVAVEETAAAIAAGELSRRVPPQDERTEVGR